jgi:RNA polymerase sigma-70 factor (ECF subfamily)
MSTVPLTPDEELERSEAKELIRHAFTNLPQRMRQVLELRWLADKSYKEISNELGMPVKSVENYLGRAMRLLRDRMTRGR